MASTVKTPNYTPAQTATMVSAYVANPSASVVAELAESMGKTVRSVVAKLSREGVYVAKTYTTKAGEPPVKKDTLADRMAVAFGLTEAEADSLTKANKTALVKIVTMFEDVAGQLVALRAAEMRAEMGAE